MPAAKLKSAAPRAAVKAGPSGLYSVHPSIAMVQTTVAKMKEKTGRSLDEWIAFIKKSGPASEEARRDWLKREHGLGTNYAGWLAAWSVGKSEEDGDPDRYLAAAETYVEAMFSGKKAALRPIYDRLLKVGLKVGKEARACPCQTMVPLFRNHVFAQIKPSTNTRIDLGLALGPMKTPKRLVLTGGIEKKDRITHRIEITGVDQIDAEVQKWLKTAYDRDA